MVPGACRDRDGVVPGSCRGGDGIVTDTARVARLTFSAAALTWAAALPLATYAASHTETSPVYILTAAVYAIGAAVCHQRPERSFHLWATQMPVCARCAGIYVGAALACAVPGVARWSRSPETAALPMWCRSPKRLALLVSLPTVATLAYEWITGITPSNWIRAAAGVVLGAGVAMLIRREVN